MICLHKGIHRGLSYNRSMTLGLLIALLVLVCVAVVLQLLLLRRGSGADSAQARVLEANLLERLERLDRLVAELPTAQTFRDESQANRAEQADAAKAQRDEQSSQSKAQREELSGKFDSFGRKVAEDMTALGKLQRDRLKDFAEALEKLTTSSDKKADALRQAVEAKLDQLQQSNEKKLEDMRKTVDEKLHKTLETRLGESFKQVSQRLEQVHRGLGEMQELAGGVSDLKRVMSNVKTRGIYGEFSLESILTQTLTPDQYDKEVCLKPGTNERVDFVVKIPEREGSATTLLPIDAKFPIEDFERVQLAATAKDQDDARRALEKTVLGFAKSLASKYLNEPMTTPYLVLFVPTEGLYAELVNRPTLFEDMQRLNVMLAGPTNLMALLHTVKVLYRNKTIEKHAEEIGNMLGVVKREFEKFEKVAERMKSRLEGTAKAFDDEIGRRARAMGRAVRGIDASGKDSPIAQIMGLDAGGEYEDEQAGSADLDALPPGEDALS